MKAMKKLNFWSRKKRKKRDYYHHYQKLPHYDFQPSYNPTPPPPRPPPSPPPRPPLSRLQENCLCHFCHPAEPSAPPLPPWLELQQEGTHSNFTSADIISEQEMGDQYISISQETAVTTANTTTTTTINTTNSQSQEIVVRTADVGADTDGSVSNLALQQHSPRREKAAATNADAAAGVFGCVVDVGGLLFRCFFPCFHISEPRSYRVSCKALDYHNMEKKIF